MSSPVGRASSSKPGRSSPMPGRSSSPKPQPKRPLSPKPDSSAVKKPRYEEPFVRTSAAHLAAVTDLDVVHQSTQLHVCFSSSSSWHVQGRTTLYLMDSSAVEEKLPGTSSAQRLRHLALHLRGSCRVTKISVEAVSNKQNGLQPLNVSEWTHTDPLQHVLLRPVITDEQPSSMFHADAQSSRGAAGMMTGLRAASMASNMGELRVSVQETEPASGSDSVEHAQQIWKDEFLQQSSSPSGAMVESLRQQIESRSTERRKARIDLMARRLAEASISSSSASDKTKSPGRAMKVTVQYEIPLEHSIHHLGGFHALTTDQTPHLYTTCGTVGDHEGPRCWLPCLDSASTLHRATHEMVIQVTAPLRHGLSCVGMGEDFGVQDAILHAEEHRLDETASQLAAVQQELGAQHVAFLQSVAAVQQRPNENGDSSSNNGPHLIPPESNSAPTSVLSLDRVRVTATWCSCSWTPLPARSLGFAIGPFKVLEDPEYFGLGAVKGDDEDDEDDEDGASKKISLEERHEAFCAAARQRGEGIRQVYFAPLYERKFLWAGADTSKLLNGAELCLAPLTARQRQVAKDLDAAVTVATVGVPHRALSLMRDILALPANRTSSYTQVWIPNAVHGGITSGALHHCPEVSINPFLGGAILDSRLLPPVRTRLPFYQGGRVLQFVQARCAVRGWITAALPLGGHDDVGTGYILSLIESFIMSFYERASGAQGQGGAMGGIFFSKRYSASSGLNSSNLDFLPVQNIEEIDVAFASVGAVPVEDKHNEQLWRSATNGSESHTSATDEWTVRQLLCADAVEALERGTDKDKGVPNPSVGWLGSHLSLSFLSSNATSSSDIGCGAVELHHPVGGLVYRKLKCDVLRGVIEGRAGVANFVRLVRAAFVASHLEDTNEKELKLPALRDKKSEKESQPSGKTEELLKPPFVVCVNEILKKKGLSHTLFTRALQNLSGKVREPHLLGTLVDVERHAEDPRTRRPFVDPEGFPNSYVRGASQLYCRVGVQVDLVRDGGSSSLVAKGIQMQAYAEPIIPEGGTAFGGPITLRVVENEGQFREYVKDLNADGSRRDWGTTFLHAKPVTIPKDQTAASGIIENVASKDAAKSSGAGGAKAPSLQTPTATSAFDETNFHFGGYQAIELIRLTNLTPLLWVRVDPLGLYGGRISVFQPDACLAEQLYHDGDARAQVDAMRALAERPTRIQGSMKVTSIFDVNVSELPVRVLGDCLRGSPALHSSLPHTPTVRAQAALSIAQWQNNKAPPTKDAISTDNWMGVNLLLQYFRERFYSNSVVMPVKFSRLVLKKSAEAQRQAVSATEGGATNQPTQEVAYQYLDALEEGEERAAALDDAEEIELEEDEEYRVRSAVISALSCVRAKDGMTPLFIIQFLETVLDAEDAEMVGKLMFPDEELMIEKNIIQARADGGAETVSDVAEESQTPTLNYVASMLVADALLSLCFINSAPAIITDPTTGKPVQVSGKHPVTKLMKLARGWLDWELYREKVRADLSQETRTGVGGNCHDTIAACAIIALSTLVILRQSTTDPPAIAASEGESADEFIRQVSRTSFFMNIFDRETKTSDLTKAACAQAIICIACAADRFEKESVQPLGLLTALEFIVDRILDDRTSPSLRHSLALLIMDACTGKVCSMQRVGAIAGRNDLITSCARFLNGPLGASHGGDNGSALLTTVSATSFPAASAVNDGARRGLRLLSRAGHPREQEPAPQETVVRVATFATRLWRIINGEAADPPAPPTNLPFNGVCAFDGTLRCTFLGLWQCIWPRGCFAVLQVQAWKSIEQTPRYKEIGAHRVMKTSDKEIDAAKAEEDSLSEINRLVNLEIDRQTWRGEMARKAYDMHKASKGSKPEPSMAQTEQGLGIPLPPIKRDSAFKQGGWIASAAQQRRALALDGGTAVTKLRLTVKSSSELK